MFDIDLSAINISTDEILIVLFELHGPHRMTRPKQLAHVRTIFPLAAASTHASIEASIGR